MMRTKLKAFQIFGQEDRKICIFNIYAVNEVKELLNLSDAKTLEVINSFTNPKLLVSKLRNGDEEVQNLLIKYK